TRSRMYSSSGRTYSTARIPHALHDALPIFKHAGSICPRADIVDFLWGNQLYIDDNALSVHVARIREKLAGIGLEGLIKTKHRQGDRKSTRLNSSHVSISYAGICSNKKEAFT